MSPFFQQYDSHLKHLKLKGLQPKTIDAYAFLLHASSKRDENSPRVVFDSRTPLTQLDDVQPSLSTLAFADESLRRIQPQCHLKLCQSRALSSGSKTL